MSYEQNLMIKIAKLYYKENLKQERIARQLDISKYKVNRILKRALSEGLIQITIIEPKNSNERLK